MYRLCKVVRKRSEAKRLLGAQEERARGVTMDVGVTHFETERVRFTLLDAPVFHSPHVVHVLHSCFLHCTRSQAPMRSNAKTASRAAQACTAAELASSGWVRGTVISSRR